MARYSNRMVLTVEPGLYIPAGSRGAKRSVKHARALKMTWWLPTMVLIC